MSETTAEWRTTLFRVNRAIAVWWDNGVKFAGARTDPAVEYLLSDEVWMVAKSPPRPAGVVCILMGNEQRTILSERELDHALYPSAYLHRSPIHTVDKEFGFKRPQSWVNPAVDEEGRLIERQSKAEQALMAYALTGDRESLYEEGFLRQV